MHTAKPIKLFVFFLPKEFKLPYSNLEIKTFSGGTSPDPRLGGMTSRQGSNMEWDGRKDDGTLYAHYQCLVLMFHFTQLGLLLYSSRSNSVNSSSKRVCQQVMRMCVCVCVCVCARGSLHILSSSYYCNSLKMAASYCILLLPPHRATLLSRSNDIFTYNQPDYRTDAPTRTLLLLFSRVSEVGSSSL